MREETRLGRSQPSAQPGARGRPMPKDEQKGALSQAAPWKAPGNRGQAGSW